MKIAEFPDILLIGAGPIGIEVAIALKKANLNYLHVEAGSIASTIAWWAQGTQIFSSPERIAVAEIPFEIYTYSKATREDYLNYLRGVVKHFTLPIQVYTRVVKISKSLSAGFEVVLAPSFSGVGGEEDYKRALDPQKNFSEVKTIYPRTLILAIGDMQLPKELGIEGEQQENVSHYFKDPHRYFGTRVAIVGAKNSAAEAVVRLARIGCEITWCCRDNNLEGKKIKPWILPEALNLIREGKVRLLTSVQPLRIVGRSMAFKDLNSESIQEVAADFILLLTGYRQDSGLFEQLGLNLIGEGKRPEFNPDTMETNIEGVFVAGTATAGTQVGGAQIFIENCHQHGTRIAKALSGSSVEIPLVKERNVEQREQ